MGRNCRNCIWWSCATRDWCGFCERPGNTSFTRYFQVCEHYEGDDDFVVQPRQSTKSSELDFYNGRFCNPRLVGLNAST